MATMKAVRLHEFGGPDVLKYEDAPRPEPGPGEVLIRVRASSVNPADWKIREGYFEKMIPHKLPLILGLDAAGTVEAVGQNVTEFQPGDEVFGSVGMTRDGSYAEFVTADAGGLAFKPKTADFNLFASVPTALTAWQALFDIAGLAAGQTILIHGAGGAVGSAAVQLAKNKGAVVIGTASGDDIAYVRGLGADTVVDYKTQKFEDFAHNVDIVLDTVGGETQARSFTDHEKGRDAGCDDRPARFRSGGQIWGESRDDPDETQRRPAPRDCQDDRCRPVWSARRACSAAVGGAAGAGEGAGRADTGKDRADGLKNNPALEVPGYPNAESPSGTEDAKEGRDKSRPYSSTPEGFSPSRPALPVPGHFARCCTAALRRTQWGSKPSLTHLGIGLRECPALLGLAVNADHAAGAVGPMFAVDKDRRLRGGFERCQQRGDLFGSRRVCPHRQIDPAKAQGAGLLALALNPMRRNPQVNDSLDAHCLELLHAGHSRHGPAPDAGRDGMEVGQIRRGDGGQGE